MFMYDNNGDAFGFQYGGKEYFYVKNLQNDITAITDSAAKVIANYYYDAWGNITEITGDAAIANINPLRYRSYYYDTETELYYLNTRYYSPDMCRFLNADGYIQTGQGVLDKNMFTYCGNSPTNLSDPSGNSWIAAILIVVAVGLAVSGCSAKTNKPTPPSNYKDNKSKNSNCYSYAFNLPVAANPGDYSIKNKNSNYMFKDKPSYTTKEITNFILRDMKELNKPVRVVSSPLDKKSNEYIVAMKTSTTIIQSIGVADYHFAVQLSDGTWADKPGATPSRWNVIDGTSITWDCGEIKDYYNTESVYFAVEK